MLKQLLSRLEPVHRAETREQREAVYRFRYRVYVEEFEGRAVRRGRLLAARRPA